MLLAVLGLAFATIAALTWYWKQSHGLALSRSVGTSDELASTDGTVHRKTHQMRSSDEETTPKAGPVRDEVTGDPASWHNIWHQGLEEASRLYFGDDNIEGFLTTLMPLHRILDREAETSRDISFVQSFGRDLDLARDRCDAYRHTRDKTELQQAWDLYYQVFRGISRQLAQLATVERRDDSVPRIDSQMVPVLDLNTVIPPTTPSPLAPPDIRKETPHATIQTSTTRPTTSSGLMPPPSAPLPFARTTLAQSRAPVTTPSSLRVPVTGPLPNRGPPGPSTPSGIGLSPRSGPSLTANTAGARNKVILKPGHSPLDWAALAKSRDLSGVCGLQRVTPSLLKAHHGRKGMPAWSSYKGKVYNITPYLPFHPGGEGELMRAAGKDGEKLFNEYHSWVNWETMLNACLVGIMVSESDGEGLDGLD